LSPKETKGFKTYTALKIRDEVYDSLSAE